jgi:hypothetical protein
VFRRFRPGIKGNIRLDCHEFPSNSVTPLSQKVGRFTETPIFSPGSYNAAQAKKILKPLIIESIAANKWLMRDRFFLNAGERDAATLSRAWSQSIG